MVTQYYLPIGLHCNRAEGVYIETKSDTTWKHIFHIPYVKLEWPCHALKIIATVYQLPLAHNLKMSHKPFLQTPNKLDSKVYKKRETRAIRWETLLQAWQAGDNYTMCQVVISACFKGLQLCDLRSDCRKSTWPQIETILHIVLKIAHIFPDKLESTNSGISNNSVCICNAAQLSTADLREHSQLSTMVTVSTAYMVQSSLSNL